MDDLLEDIAACGPLQTLVLVVGRLQAVAAVWSNVMMMFGGYNPGWTCSTSNFTNLSPNMTNDYLLLENERPKLFSNSISTILPAIGPIETNSRGINLSSSKNVTCGQPLKPNFDILANCGNMSLCDTVEFVDSASTIVTRFSLICDREDAVSLIILLTMAGALIGSICGGQFGERFGRKTACYGSTLILVLSNLAALFSPSWQIYAVISLISGIGCGGIFVSYIVYGYEFLNPKWRGIVGGIPSWNLSMALFGVIVLLLKDWWYLHLATCCFSGLSFLTVFWAPESIRWLHAHGKEERLKTALKQVMKVNNRQDDVDDILQKLRTSGQRPSQRIYSFLDLFRTRSIRLISAKCTVIALLLTMFYFTFAFSVKTLSGDIYSNLLLAGVIEIPFTLCTIPIINTFGRRITNVIFMSGACLCSFAIVVSLLFDGDSSAGSDIIKYSSLVAKGFGIASWVSLVTLIQELYPTVIRNVGQGYLMVMSRAGAMLSPYLIPKHDKHDSFLITYISITVGFVFNIFLITTLPETNKKPLEDWIDQSEMVSNEKETHA